MIWANGLDGDKVLATPDGLATCPCCDEEVVAKCGRIVSWHWAHKSRTDCDPWSEPETPWHAAWKSRYERTEVVIEKADGAGVARHRADAVSKVYGRDTVIEFQHSSLEAAAVKERETFYGNMIWIVDACEAIRSRRITLYYYKPESGSDYVKFKWRHRKRSFDDCRCPLFLDFGVSWVPSGPPFFKDKMWWDDSGLKDGWMRRPGWWQRIRKFPCLLDVRKHEDGKGWGRIVSHEEFCNRTAGVGFVPFGAASRGESLVRDNHLGGAIRFEYPPQNDEEVCGWCLPQLNHLGVNFTSKEVV